MKIITCYKLVPEEQDIAVNKDGTLDISKADPKISQFDLSAIEVASEIKSQLEGSTVIALSVGGKALENTKARKDVLSRGADELALVIDDRLTSALPAQTAQVLAAAVKKIDYKLVICGDGSGDLYAQQVGLLLGQALEIPCINGVSKIVSVQSNAITVERALEDEVEVLEIALPAVISVSADINEPKIPSMKAILGAAKKQVNVFNYDDLSISPVSALSEMLSVKAPEQKERQRLVVEGDGDEQISAFVEHVRKALK